MFSDTRGIGMTYKEIMMLLMPIIKDKLPFDLWYHPLMTKWLRII
jgi:hypothetical protein